MLLIKEWGSRHHIRSSGQIFRQSFKGQGGSVFVISFTSDTDQLHDLEEVPLPFCAQFLHLQGYTGDDLYIRSPPPLFPHKHYLWYTWKLKYTDWYHGCLCPCFILFLKGKGHIVFNIISHKAPAQGLPHRRQMEDFGHEDSLTWFSFLSSFAHHGPSLYLFWSWISISLIVQLPYWVL